MQHSILRKLFFLPLLSCVVLVHAQQEKNYLTEVFGTRNGLISPYIYKVLQDSKHYLWVGTKIGASRFNGYEFENFQYTFNHEQVGKIVAIAEDSLHRIWLGGERGLFCFSNDTVSEVKFSGNARIEVEAMICGASGNIFVGSVEGLFQIPPGFKVNGQPVPPNQILNFINRVSGLELDKYQNLYIGTYSGIYIAGKKRESIKQVWTNPNESDFVRSIAALSPDTIYWSTREAIAYQLLNGKSFLTANNNYLGRNFFVHDHNIYGLLFNYVAKMNNNGPEILYDLNPLTNFPADALIDAEGNFWVGSWEGLFKFRQNPFHVYHLLNSDHPEAFSFLEDDKDHLLFGGNRGGIFFKEENEIVPYPAISQKVFPSAEVLCMYQDNSGGLWFGSGYNGISHWKNGKLRTYTEDDSLADNSCYSFLHTSGGKLFGCTGKGIVEIILRNENPAFKNYDFEKKYSRDPELYGGFETSHGELLFYGNQGIFILKNSRLQSDSIHGFPFTSFNIKKIVRDTKGMIWIATQGNGLLLCSESSEGIFLQKQFLKKDGLPSDVILSVLTDKNDNVWISDFNGVSFIRNDGSYKIYSFDEHDGLLSNYYQDLELEQQKDGSIWGLSTLGIFSFHPDSILFNSVVPDMQLNNALLFDGKFDLNQYTATSDGDANVKWKLPYNKNSISFSYTAVSLTESSKNQYAYRLKGLDSSWHYTKVRKAVFNYLPPGSYSFEVKGSNNSDVWSKPVGYSFIISIPWWQTWWFKLLLFFIGAGALFLIWKEQEKRRARKQLMEEKDRKLTELKRSMDEARLMAIRSQMNPHFIFNCMSAIQKLIVTRDDENASKYLSRFSKLLRMVLDHSDKNFIPLSEDVEVNRLYLELESLRFKQAISFSIDVDKALEDDDALLPGLLIQPFIENALLHGLLNKEGERRLALKYFLKDENLVCEISDNGVGRRKAREIKSQKLGGSGYESKGIKLSAQRIDLLNQQTGGTASMMIEDEIDSEGTASGTTVRISIPIRLAEINSLQ